EDETRRLNESQNELLKLLDENEDTDVIPVKNKTKAFTPKTWTSESKVSNSGILERNNNENEEDNLKNAITDCPRDATKEIFGFNDMSEESDSSLSIISYVLKFVRVQDNQGFLSAERDVQAKMLYAYHTKVNKMKAELARRSFFPAPLPKATSVIDTFPSILEDVDFQETYTSRSGRQTKRKIYNYDEDDDSLDSSDQKKMKNSEEDEWLNKTTPNKGACRPKKTETNLAAATKDSSELETNGVINSTTNDENTKPPQAKAKPKPSVLKKLNNEEIMKRSRLFAGQPKRRCEILFDNLKDEEEKKQKEEKVMEAFNKTLEQLNEDENDSVPSEVANANDYSNRRRVVPTIPRRQPIGNRKRGLTPLNIKVTPNKEANKQDSGSSSRQEADELSPRTTVRKRLSLHKSSITKSNGIETFPSTSQVPKNAANNEVKCPICDCTFEEDKIEEHAATCGDEPFTPATKKVLRITCSICDTIVPPDVEYDVHVRECEAKNRDKL
ncbi:hypothetical protein NQ318_014161, partial [Aromia moschata]